MPQRTEAELLEREGIGKVFVGEGELARCMTDYVVAGVERAGATAGGAATT